MPETKEIPALKAATKNGELDQDPAAAANPVLCLNSIGPQMLLPAGLEVDAARLPRGAAIAAGRW